ncbi:MAG: PhoH family protein [Elusimicrobiota bacterium]
MSKQIYIKNTSDLLLILGPQDIYLREMEKEFKVKIFVDNRNNSEEAFLTIKGKLRNVNKAENRIKGILERYYEKENTLTNNNDFEKQITEEQGVVYCSEFGEKIKPKTPNQKFYVESIYDNDIVISIGPAGTGKTFLATAVALRFLKDKKVKKIVVTRPIVEVGEKLGFLPGDIDNKVNPYLKPVYDNFYNLLGPEKFQIYKDEEIIETLPLAYMRGRTLNNSFIILDEAQNTTTLQMKMFLTRMGMNSKIVITGDITQIDLKESSVSGLITSMEILKEIKEIKIVKLDNSDIIRHPLVSKIVDAYQAWEKK